MTGKVKRIGISLVGAWGYMTENQISANYRYIERLPTIKIYENIAYIKWISETYLGNARFVKSL